jgi:hypothetical protein
MSSDDGPAAQRIDRHIVDLDAVLQDDDLVGRVGMGFLAPEQPIDPGFAATYESFGLRCRRSARTVRDDDGRWQGGE